MIAIIRRKEETDSWALEALVQKADFYTGNQEPSLNELFDDPTVRAMMDSDGLRKRNVMSFVGKARTSIHS